MGEIADWMVDQALEQGLFLRSPGPRERMWTTAEGKRLRVRDMDNGHLVNTIRMLERRADGEIGACMAIAAAEYDGYSDVFDDADVGSIYPIYDDMVAEAKRRGLDLTVPAFAANRIANTDEFPTCEPSKK